MCIPTSDQHEVYRRRHICVSYPDMNLTKKAHTRCHFVTDQAVRSEQGSGSALHTATIHLAVTLQHGRVFLWRPNKEPIPEVSGGSTCGHWSGPRSRPAE